MIPYTVVPKASFTNLPVNCVKRKHKEEKYFDIKYLFSNYNLQQSKWKTVERDDLCNYQISTLVVEKPKTKFESDFHNLELNNVFFEDTEGYLIFTLR